MKDFDDYKSELDNLYLEEQISKCNYELYIENFSPIEEQLIYESSDKKDKKKKKKKNENKIQILVIIFSPLLILLSLLLAVFGNILLGLKNKKEKDLKKEMKKYPQVESAIVKFAKSVQDQLNRNIDKKYNKYLKNKSISSNTLEYNSVKFLAKEINDNVFVEIIDIDNDKLFKEYYGADYNTTINNYLHKDMYMNDDGMFILDKNIKQIYDSIVKSCEELDKEIQNITGSKLIHINLTDNTEYSEDTIYYTIYLAINFDKIENIKLPENIKKEVDKKIKQLKIN